MFSSQSIENDLILIIYSDTRTVFRLRDVAMLSGETNFISLSKKLIYYVHAGKLQNPRKGVYAKPGYNTQELACILHTPSYLSLEFVLQRAGVVFQYDSGITALSYLSRTVEVDKQEYRYRKIKGEILVNTEGIIRQENHVNIASPERAFLDLLYLNGETTFDNLNPLDKRLVRRLVSLYQSKILKDRVTKMM